MRSEFIAFEEGFVGFTQQTLRSLSHPCGTARAVSSEPLSAMETALLTYFRKNVGRTLSREELAERVWNQRHFYGSRTIDQTVSKLRKKLRHRATIQSVWSAGYRFENESVDAEGSTRVFEKRP